MLERPSALAVGLFCFYLFASLFMNPNGYLSTDTGGKTATVSEMAANDNWSLDIGYWAESSDPEGELHPYWATTQRADQWVNVTTIPMVVAAKPLWELGGPSAILILPMLGSVAAALAGGRLSQQFGATQQWPAILVVGLASPAAIYALDFWEHSLGLALMAWATVGVLSSVEHGASSIKAVAPALWAGIGFGFAANMRQEAMIYGLIAGLFLVWSHWSSSRSSRFQWLFPSAAMALGTISMLAGYALVERQFIGEVSRASRSVDAAAEGGSAGLSLRLSEAAVTFASPADFVQLISVVLAAFVAAGLIWGTTAHRGSSPLRQPLALLLVSALFVVVRLVASGPYFIPGLLAASPIVGAGIGLAFLARNWSPLILALGPLPMVWFFQYPGAAAPQWGGRYILLTGLILTAYAMSQVNPFGLSDGASNEFTNWSKGLVAASVVTTLIGLAFLNVRSNDATEAMQVLAERPEEVLVFDNPFLARESGPVGLSEQWLAAPDRDKRQLAAQLLVDHEVESFGFVAGPESEIEFEGFEVVDSELVAELVELPIWVYTFERAAS